MNSQSNAMGGSRLEAQVTAAGEISWAQRMYWSIRRELWENRSIYVAPLAVAALVLIGSLIGMFRLPGRMTALSALSPMQQQEAIAQPYTYAALAIMFTTFIVTVFYSLDALYGERRDRSILFWKSLPVSDLTTVVSKASIPIVIIPLLTFAITVVTQWIMVLLSSAALLMNGLSVASLWTTLSLSQSWLMLLYHLVAVHALWYAPIYAWLLLVSAWARRVPILWAGLPLLAIALVEKIAFNTTHFAVMLEHRMDGGIEGAPFTSYGGVSHVMAHHNLAEFVVRPGLWIGLLVAAIFLAGAVRLRRERGPS